MDDRIYESKLLDVTALWGGGGAVVSAWRGKGSLQNVVRGWRCEARGGALVAGVGARAGERVESCANLGNCFGVRGACGAGD